MSVKLQLLKIFSLNGIATIIRVVFNLLLIKTMAFKLGTTGMAYFGQLTSLLSIVSIVSTAGITNGIVKYTAEFKKNKKLLLQYINSANRISIVVSLVNAILLIAFSSIISDNLFGDTKYFWVIISFGLILLFYVLSTIVIAILNGFGEYTKVIKINVLYNIISNSFSILSTFFWGLEGALFSIAISQFFQFTVALFFVNKKYDNFFIKGYRIRLSNVFLKYRSFAIMSFFSAICIPLSLMFIKQIIIKYISINDAGIYEGLLKISNVYLGIISTTLTFYFLPRFASANEIEIKNDLYLSFKVIMPCALFLLMCVFLVKDILIVTFLSAEFLKIKYIIGWQLIGDFFRISSYLFAILLVAKNKVKRHIIFEVFYALTFVGTSLFFIKYKDLNLIPLSYAISTFLVFGLLVATHFYKNIIK
jgi:O-antigen/teichoic acid export membrane protein